MDFCAHFQLSHYQGIEMYDLSGMKKKHVPNAIFSPEDTKADTQKYISNPFSDVCTDGDEFLAIQHKQQHSFCRCFFRQKDVEKPHKEKETLLQI